MRFSTPKQREEYAKQAKLSAQALAFNGLSVKSINDKDVSMLRFSDIDLCTNLRKSEFGYGETKEFDKPFNTGYKPDGGLVTTKGPILRAMSFVNDHKSASFWAFLWHDVKSNEVIHLEDCYLKMLYYKGAEDNTGTMYGYDLPVPFSLWWMKHLVKFKGPDYPNGVINLSEQEFWSEGLEEAMNKMPNARKLSNNEVFNREEEFWTQHQRM